MQIKNFQIDKQHLLKKINKQHDYRVKQKKNFIWKFRSVWGEDTNQNLCKTFPDFMPRHIEDVIKNDGYHTKY